MLSRKEAIEKIFLKHGEQAIYITNTGKKVATKKEINSSDSVINLGKYFAGKIKPTNKDWVKFGLGKNRRPPNKPIIIEKIICFVSTFFL